MLNAIRRKLRMIRYYSAPRPRTVWTRATDIALVASFFLAVPVMWVCDLMIIRAVPVIGHSGQLFRMPGQGYGAVVLTLERTRPVDSSGTVIGMFQIRVEDMHHGWPLSTTVRRRPAMLDLDLREEVRARPNVRLAADDPIRLAIVDVLEHEGEHAVTDAWPAADPASTNRLPDVAVKRSWLAWVFGSGLWWLMLMFGSYAAIQIVKLASLVVMARKLGRRDQLRAENKCITCGYDMTGLEFNERCPECGNIVW